VNRVEFRGNAIYRRTGSGLVLMNGSDELHINLIVLRSDTSLFQRNRPAYQLQQFIIIYFKSKPATFAFFPFYTAENPGIIVLGLYYFA